MSPSPPSVSIAADGPRLSVVQSLQFKLGILFTFVAIALSFGAWWIGRILVQDNLVEDTQRYQRESALRLAQATGARLDRAEVLAATVAALIPDGDPKRWSPQIPALAQGSGLGRLVTGVGVWPEPKMLDPARDRASVFWLADDAGVLRPRDDYNDPRAIGYSQEAWYTPARYVPKGSCFWTPAFREFLSKREVVACTMALRDARGFIGAVTVLLDLAVIDQLFGDDARTQSGYSLLADRSNRLLSIAGAAKDALAVSRPRNLPGLAQQMPAFNTLALDLHARDEAFLSRAVQSPLYDAAQISALKDATREGSRQDAEAVLAVIWNSARQPATAEAPLKEVVIKDDPILEENASATIYELPGSFWKLIRATRAREGVAGAQYFFTQTLVVVCGTLILVLVIVFAGMRALVLRRLTHMAARLSDARTLEESMHVQLDSSPNNELGLIAHWYNERVRQLRDAMDRTMTQQSQLSVETAERGKSDELSLRARERASALMSSVADGVIVIDAKGIVEDMNTAAEQLTGVPGRTGRGRPLADVLRVRVDGSSPDLAAAALAATDRIEHGEGVHLGAEGRGDRDLHLVIVPLLGPAKRSLGAAFVFRLREVAATSTRLVIDRRSVDPVTGLPTRSACDRRLRALLETSKLQTTTHAIVVADVDRLRSINETAGQRAADEILMRIAETLVSGTPGSEVYRLGADSFAMVLENHGIEDAQRVAESVREDLATARFRWEGDTLSVTASFGIAGFGGGSEHPIELIRRAEEACGLAKREGRNCVRIFDPALDLSDAATDAATWVRRIRAGLDEGLFHLTTQWIQPSGAHAAEGAVFDVSLALEDEEGFWAEPAQFLPIAERAGLVAEVERWAMKQTLDYLARNPDVVARLAFCTLSLSGPTISDGNTLELLAHTLQQHEQLPPGRICFVLRESALSDAPGPALSFCDAMRSLGCRVAIDHTLGRGVGAVDLFRKLPAEFLRIDARHFVDLTGDAVDQIIAESLLKLGRTLHRRTIVAEIGDEGARDTWRRMGADYLHGLAVARPSPVVFAPSG